MDALQSPQWERITSSGYEGRSSHTVADDVFWPHHGLQALLDNAAPLECIMDFVKGHCKRVAFITDLIPAEKGERCVCVCVGWEQSLRQCR